MKKDSSHFSIFRYIFFLLFFGVVSVQLIAQVQPDDEFERMLLEEVEVENPQYKPVIGLGLGTFSFFGDVNDFHRYLPGSQLGVRLNVSTFLDRGRFFKLNFFFFGGNLSGNERSFVDPQRNLNFKTELLNIGINFEYTFGHLVKPGSLITPFVSAGIESFQFNSKGDLSDSDGNRYFYWNDGTIRDVSQTSPLSYLGTIIARNHNYETDLRQADLYGLGAYPQIALAIPVEAGFDFKISERVKMRMAASLHFAMTDVIDNVSSAGSPIQGKKSNDWFSFSYVTFHLDLFSDPKTRVIERLFAMQEFDYTTVEDEDNDGVFDFFDLCPGTPLGVEVDMDGCPLDSDGDGVHDYLDKEANTRPGAFVDEHGVEISPENIMELLMASSEAIARNQIHLYEVSMFARRGAGLPIPPRFKFVDMDNDGFISYEELLKAIDDFFDFKSSLTTLEIYELNEFFFAQ